jgi:hypothetical protein
MKLSVIAEQCYADCHLCLLPFEFIKTVCRVIYTFYHKIEKMNVFKKKLQLHRKKIGLQSFISIEQHVLDTNP